MEYLLGLEYSKRLAGGPACLFRETGMRINRHAGWHHHFASFLESTVLFRTTIKTVRPMSASGAGTPEWYDLSYVYSRPIRMPRPFHALKQTFNFSPWVAPPKQHKNTLILHTFRPGNVFQLFE